ncbi:hypothetical protein [Spiroplasma citri]|uniref:Uncharacterized protein n=1 Tax=Spiroplasma citri TaxID=2133 RepID=A0AAJ4EIZ8_SPICI|nr:hypothetical protein [Spiroplasma citri]APE74586.1 hypothetical protein SCITRI_00690 [Spiroplasma citri]QIA66788.1 hypothetical protein GMI18_03450 [Spiroplasma citri]QIA68067.1 hypothetical protein GMI18_10975 [Spiroplasma citri]QIA68660.1 hypothetical protein GL298_03495 [Spiroplasma citri]QIA70528.1 hypothetical protein GL981_03490 [Spiroplasma citri]
MTKKYLLIMKSDFSNDILTKSFYTLEEAKITANVEMKHDCWLTTIIDLEDKNIKWQGDK